MKYACETIQLPLREYLYRAVFMFTDYNGSVEFAY